MSKQWLVHTQLLQTRTHTNHDNNTKTFMCTWTTNPRGHWQLELESWGNNSFVQPPLEVLLDHSYALMARCKYGEYIGRHFSIRCCAPSLVWNRATPRSPLIHSDNTPKVHHIMSIKKHTLVLSTYCFSNILELEVIFSLVDLQDIQEQITFKESRDKGCRWII